MINKIAGIELSEVWTGIAGEDLFELALCRVGPDGKFWLASADDRSTMPGIVLAEHEVVAGGAGRFIRRGRITNNSWNFTVGQLVHAGLDPGKLSHNFPGSHKQLQLVGMATAVNQIDFDPNFMLVEAG